MSVKVVNHPLVRHKIGLLRKLGISTMSFRDLTTEITRLLAYEATSDLATEHVTIEGWAGPVDVERIAGKKVTIVPVLRAGLGMVNGVLDLIPSARISVVGAYRDEETLEPVNYYSRMTNNLEQRTALILDPMLATGGTFMAAISLLKSAGCKRMKGISLVASPEGVAAVSKNYPDVDVFVASIDKGLNQRGYILPGLGDAGDKLFGTK